MGQALTIAGRAQLGLGELDPAEKYFQQAEEKYTQAGQGNLVMEPIAGTANILLIKADPYAAMTHTENILNHLDEVRKSATSIPQDQVGALPGLEGTHDPMWIYLVCCQVLSAVADHRAGLLIQHAYDLIQQQASRITDPDLHYSFLNNVRTNQGIQSLIEGGGLG